MSSEQDGSQVFHDRADHEDTLLLSRTNLFISFNGFLAIAVGLVGDRVIKMMFILMVLIVNLAWCRWAPEARNYIRALRDTGGNREDEKLWKTIVGEREKKYWWFSSPLTIFTRYIPLVLTVGWIGILLHHLRLIFFGK